MNNYLLEFGLCHLLLFAGYWALLRRQSPHLHQRAYLLGTSIFALVIPFLHLPKLYSASAESIPMLPRPEIAVDQSTAYTLVEASTDYTHIWIGVYALVSAVFLLRMLYSVYRVLSLKKGGIPQSTLVATRVIRLRNFTGSFSFLHWIFLGDDIDDKQHEHQAIIRHELGHVKLGHTYDLLFLELVCCVFWWLPSAWMAVKEIKNIHEYQADAYAIRDFGTKRYSSILISSTLKSHGLSMISSFHDSSIIKRLQEMNTDAKTTSISRTITLASLCATLLCMFACTEENFAQEEPVSVSENFRVVEEQPTYPGGMDEFYKYIMQEIRYPSAARKKGIEGQVHLQFVVERDGSLTNVEVVKGIGQECDEEAKRVLKSIDHFTPGRQRGRTVRVRMRVPFEFKLQAGKTNPDGSQQGSVIIGEVQDNLNKLSVDVKYRDGAWHGIVRDEEGNTLPGASVLVIGTNRGTVSDLDGSFHLPAAQDEKVVVSFVGYESAPFSGVE